MENKKLCTGIFKNGTVNKKDFTKKWIEMLKLCETGRRVKNDGK